MQIVGYKTFLGFLKVEEPVTTKYCGWQSDPITEPQKKMLRGLGIGHTGLTTKGQASFVISIAVERRNKGLATPGQMWAMARMGYKGIAFWTFVQAQEFLDEDYQSRRPPVYW